MDDYHHNTSTNRAEAERLLGIAEKLLRNNDLTSSKEFAILAQESEPLLEGPEQILGIVEVLLAAERRVSITPNSTNKTQKDWYSILQIAPKTDDFELIRKQYRRLALLLHPDKNKFPFSDAAFHLVADSWAVLSDPVKKSNYDSELTLFSKVDLVGNRNKEVPVPKQPSSNAPQPNSANKWNEKLPVRRSTSGAGGSGAAEGAGAGEGVGQGGRTNLSGDVGNNGVRSRSFWTACPYCYYLYEYGTEYEGCCLKCQNCERGFTAVGVVKLPPSVPGKEQYYCCWGVFPMGFSSDKNGGGFTNWVPPMSSGGGVAEEVRGGEENVNINMNSNANAHQNSNAEANQNANANANANAHPHPHPHANISTNPNTNVNANVTRPATVVSGKKRGRPRKIV